MWHDWIRKHSRNEYICTVVQVYDVEYGGVHLAGAVKVTFLPSMPTVVLFDIEGLRGLYLSSETSWSDVARQELERQVQKAYNDSCENQQSERPGAPVIPDQKLSTAQNLAVEK